MAWRLCYGSTDFVIQTYSTQVEGMETPTELAC